MQSSFLFLWLPIKPIEKNFKVSFIISSWIYRKSLTFSRATEYLWNIQPMWIAFVYPALKLNLPFPIRIQFNFVQISLCRALFNLFLLTVVHVHSWLWLFLLGCSSQEYSYSSITWFNKLDFWPAIIIFLHKFICSDLCCKDKIPSANSVDISKSHSAEKYRMILSFWVNLERSY